MSVPTAPLATRRSVGGFDLRVEWDDAALTRPVEQTLGYFHPEPPAPPGTPALTVRFSTRGAPLTVPAGAKLLSETRDGLQFLRQPDALYLRFRDAVVRADPLASVAHGTLGATVGPLRDAVLYSFLVYGTVALLDGHGVRTLHGACLVRDGHGCLVVGQSDSGKSTLTMRLVEQGWHYLTDDSVLLSRGRGGVEARPLRQDFCLDPEAAALFPHVADHWEPHLADPRKRRLHIRSLYPDRAAAWCIPRTLLFPRIVPDAESRLVPVGSRTALLGLLEQTGAPFLSDGASAASHLDDLARLAEQAQGYHLRAGRDLRDNPDAAARLTRQLLSAAPAT